MIFLRSLESVVTMCLAFHFFILLMSATILTGTNGNIEYIEWGGLEYLNVSTVNVPDPSHLEIKKLSSKPPNYPWAQCFFTGTGRSNNGVCVSQPGFCYYACRTWSFDVMTLQPDGSDTDLCLAQSSKVRREDKGFSNDNIMQIWPELIPSSTKYLILPSKPEKSYNLFGRYAYAFGNRYQHRATVPFSRLRLPSGYCITGCDAVGMEYQTCQSMGLPDTGAAGRIKMDALELVFLIVTSVGTLYFGTSLAG